MNPCVPSPFSSRTPQGWIEGTVGELLPIIRGVGFPATAKQPGPGPGIIGCLRTTNVQRAVEWEDLWFIPESYMRSPVQQVRRNDILISLANSLYLVGKVALVGEVPQRATLGAFISAIRTPHPLDARFIYYQFAAEQVQAAIRSMASTTTNISNVSTTKLAILPLRIAPCDEQSRIADRIDELFTELDAGVAALTRVKNKLPRYRAALLHAAVTGRLTADWRAKHGDGGESGEALLQRILKARRADWEARTLAKYRENGKEPPKGWNSRYLEPNEALAAGREELPAGWTWATVEQLTRGDRSSAYGVLKPGPNTPCGVPLVRVGDLSNGSVNIDGLKRIRHEISASFSRTVLEGGELLMSLVGTIGRTAIAPTELAEANTARAVGVIPLSALVNNRYVELWFRNPERVTEMTLKSHEVARKTLNLEDVRPTLVALAPISEQAVIVERAQLQLSRIDVMEREIERGLRRSARLRQSILKSAFEGRLVPQDPNEEPASVLLARIRQQAASESSNKAKKKITRRPTTSNAKNNGRAAPLSATKPEPAKKKKKRSQQTKSNAKR